MLNVQLEFNFENETKEKIEFDILQKQITALAESQNKVRKKLFAENSHLKKRLLEAETQIQELKNRLSDKKETEFEYISAENLFELKQA